MPNVSVESLSSPQVATYKKVRIPFASSLDGRQYTNIRDPLIINFLTEKFVDPLTKEEKITLIKRPGLVDAGVGSTYPSGASGESRGIFVFNSQIISVFGTTVYRGTSSIQTLATSTGKVGFCLCSDSTAEYLFICDGTNAYRLTTTGTITAVTGEPSPHIPTPVFVDGYVFLGTTNGDIFNSNLEDFLTWSSSNFITAEMYPDNLVGLEVQNNSVVAFGEESTQFFYDAGNASGTPLALVPNASLKIGTSSFSSFIRAENFIFFVSETNTGGKSVWMLDGFQVKKISTEAIDRKLIGHQQVSEFQLMAFKAKGHFILIVRNGLSDTSGLGTAYVYDVDVKTWVVWDSYMGTPNQFPYLYSSAQTFDATVYIQRADNEEIHRFSEEMYKDLTNNITCFVRTYPLDFGNDNRKFMSSLRIIGDHYFYGGSSEGDSTEATTSLLSLRYNDKDYSSSSWSDTKTIDIVTQPYIKRLGQFRRRVFEFTYTDAYPIRLEAFEVDINQGMG